VRGLLVPVLCGALATTTGCYSTTLVDAPGATPLRRAGQDELVLESSDGDRVRVGPNSRVRFLRTDGYWTDWVDGDDLCVSREVVARCPDGPEGVEGVRWKYVDGVEVENLDGLTTYAVVVLTTAVVAAVVVLVVLSAKGGGGSGGGHGGGGGHAGGGGGVAHGVHTGGGVGKSMPFPARAGAGAPYDSSGGGAWYGPRFSVDIGDSFAADPTDDTPAPASTGITYQRPLPDGSIPPPPPPPPPRPPPAAAEPATPLLSGMARRRGVIRLVGALEGGTDFTLARNATTAVALGLRFVDTLELAGGLRLIASPDNPQSPTSPVDTSAVVFGRLILNLDVDSHRRVALPFGVDVGAGQADFHGRLVAGVRVRVYEGLSLGVYPFNPTFTAFAEDSRQRSDLGWFTFPTTAEVSYSY